jgi:exopolysaccharide production protein ExoQ
MLPALASIVFAVGIAGLFLLDRDRTSRPSPALWLVVVWMSIAGSRMVSQWLTPDTGLRYPDRYLDGSPLDRVILTVLLVAGLVVLTRRWQRVEALLRANRLLLLFFLYCGISVVWSDFPDVAFKRWTKAVGDLVMVMVILTSVDPRAAIRWTISRTGFLLIPASVLLIKYYPDLGRGYNQWNWGTFLTGVATEKNGLGYDCLIFGLGFLWCFITALQSDAASRRRTLVAQGVALAMTLWLLTKADSVTALLCFVLGGSLLILTNARGALVTPARVHSMIAVVGLFVMCVLVIASDTGLAAFGRDTTLTGRTELWRQLSRMVVDPLFGTGFDSFWLGDRVERIWSIYWWRPNQAHNGYFEIFLNLGIVGLALLGAVIVWGYRNIAGSFRSDPQAARLKLAYFAAAVVFNFTEAAYKEFHPVWIAFLLAVTIVPFAPPCRLDTARARGAAA